MAILLEKFDSVTAPAIPATVTVDSGLVTTAASISGMSAPNQLVLTGATGHHACETVVSDGVGGNVTAIAKFRQVYGSQVISIVYARATASMLGGTASGTTYGAMILSGVGLRLYKWVAGSATQIDTTVGDASTFATGISYRLVLRASGSILLVWCQRLSDSKFLSGAGSWGSAEALAIGTTDTSISAASGKAGVDLYLADAGDTAYADDLSLSVNQNVFGDSIAFGYGATVGWPVLLGVSRNQYWYNASVSGDQAADAAIKAYGIRPDASLVMVGTNDQRTGGYGSNATKRGQWVKIMYALLMWCALPTKKYAQNADASTGSWSNTSVYGGTVGKNISSSGATLTFNSISGDVIYVGYTIQDGQTGTFKVKVDGSDVATGETAGNGITTINGAAYSPALLRISGMGAGSHTVVFETTNAGLCYCDFVAGIGNQTALNTVKVANIISPNSTGFASFGVDEANVGAFNSDLSGIVYVLKGDGIPIAMVDLHALTISYQADGLHPDDTGQAQIASAFSAAIDPIVRRVFALQGVTRAGSY